MLRRNSRSLTLWSCLPWVISGDGTVLLLASATPFLFLPPAWDSFYFAEIWKAPSMMGFISHISRCWSWQVVWQAEEPSDLPEHLPSRNILPSACFSCVRTRSEGCLWVLQRVEEGPHWLLAVRNGLLWPWDMQGPPYSTGPWGLGLGLVLGPQWPFVPAVLWIALEAFSLLWASGLFSPSREKPSDRGQLLWQHREHLPKQLWECG